MTDEDSILAANTAYYHAFSKADIVGMSAIWAEDESPVFIRMACFDRRTERVAFLWRIFRNPLQEPLEHQKHHVIATGDDGESFALKLWAAWRSQQRIGSNASMVRGG